MELGQLGEHRAAAIDERARSARRVLAAQLRAALNQAGEQLHVVGWIVGPGRVDGTSPFGNGDDGLVELGYVAQASGELVRGTVQSLEQHNLYSGAALIRQLVEMEYLVWSFGERPDTWGDWLRSSQEERRQSWQPGHLRKASDGHFNETEYGKHCELGGHPTPPGIRALLGAVVARDVMAELLWSELCQHGERIWTRLLAAAEAHVSPLPDLQLGIEAALEEWRSSDRLAADLSGGRSA